MITKTNLSSLPQSVHRADFVPEWFETLILQKGRKIIHETTLVCPCKNLAGGHSSSCQNCGGSGLVFVNPTEVKMIVTNSDVAFKLKEFILESESTINITASHQLRLAYNDRLMLKDSISWFGEDIQFFKEDINGITRVLGRSSYPIIELEMMFLFVNVITPLRRMTPADYTISNNIIYLSEEFVNSYPSDRDDGVAGIKGTVRYSHHPYYMISEMKRESMEQYIPDWKNKSQEDQLKRLPIAAIAKRMHDVIKSKDITKELLNNSFTIPKTC
jgi:hypothetical protein